MILHAEDNTIKLLNLKQPGPPSSSSQPSSSESPGSAPSASSALFETITFPADVNGYHVIRAFDDDPEKFLVFISNVASRKTTGSGQVKPGTELTHLAVYRLEPGPDGSTPRKPVELASTLITGYSSEVGASPSASGRLVAFLTSKPSGHEPHFNPGQDDYESASLQWAFIWDVERGEIMQRIPLVFKWGTPSPSQEPRDPSIKDEYLENFVEAHGLQLLPGKRLLVAGRAGTGSGLGFPGDRNIFKIFSFDENEYQRTRLSVFPSGQFKNLDDYDMGLLVSQASVSKYREPKLLAVCSMFDNYYFMDEIMSFEDIEAKKRCPRTAAHMPCCGDFKVEELRPVEHLPEIGTPVIAGYRAICGAKAPPRILLKDSENGCNEGDKEKTNSCSPNTTNILINDYSPARLIKALELSKTEDKSLLARIRIHVQRSWQEYDFVGSEIKFDNRKAEIGWGVTIDEQEQDDSFLSYIQTRIQLPDDFSARNKADQDHACHIWEQVWIWQGGLVLVGQTESILLYFEEDED
ncbi:hypothetical protein IE53DRAFT_383030 [Violaceomyces palustris]|uniref:Uncharacterized protein n=1 Tax=Violaceomyces palustris TaxID=1673888 RepID=A0ACD0P8F2_9BASI|nr:hypothetical protein IE53DRAFT_383030 [Violaceomyces palustris]